MASITRDLRCITIDCPNLPKFWANRQTPRDLAWFGPIREKVRTLGKP